MFYPFGNGTTPGAPAWRAEPTYRGTFNILSSSLTTLALCVWTAVHLNIPEKNAGNKQFWRKAVCLLLGVFAPELLVWTAYTQYRDACELNKRMKKVFGNSEPSLPLIQRIPFLGGRYHKLKTAREDSEHDIPLVERMSSRGFKRSWSMVQSHYVAMGGIAIEIGKDDHDFFPIKFTRLTLTVAGVNMLLDLEPDLFPYLPRDDIIDRSKANGFAKTITCIQATWFCIQCIVRLAQGLSISILELNTFVHALCALLIYRLWWDKPLDVGQPTVIQIESEPARELFALMALSKFGKCFGFQHCTPCTAHKRFQNPIDAVLEIDRFKLQCSLKTTAPQPAPNRDLSMRLFVDGELHGFTLLNTGGRYNSSMCSHLLFSSDILRLELASKALRRYHSIVPGRLVEHLKSSLDGTTTFPFPTNKLANREKNRPWQWLWDVENAINSSWKPSPLIVGVSLAGLVYGGMHILAWNAPFSTATERILWHISSITLVVPGLALALGLLFIRILFVMLVELEDTWWNIFLTWPLALVFCLVTVSSVFLMGFSRVFLVVECFLNLKHLPDTAYVLPAWSVYFPHFS